MAARPPLPELFEGTKDKADRNKRIYQVIYVYEYTLKEVAEFLGLYYSTTSVIANRVAEAQKHQK